MPLSPFRKRKIERMFSLLDLDGDGQVEQADYVRRVDALVRLRGWGVDSPE